MLDLFLTLDQALHGLFEDVRVASGQGTPAGLLLAFLAGLLLTFSPTCLALLPALAAGALGGGGPRLASAFLAGLLALNLALGVAATVFGAALQTSLAAGGQWWGVLSAGLLLLLGLQLAQVLRVRGPRVSLLARAARSPWGAFLLAWPFSIGSCPACLGLLAAVLLGAAASGQPAYGALLLFAFTLGRALPILLVGTSVERVRRLAGISRRLPTVQRAVGLILAILALGLLYVALSPLGGHADLG